MFLLCGYSIAMEPLEYYLCDVFTGTPLAGNQLAVFVDAGHLSTEQMQAIARETNLSETTFLCRRDPALEAERGYRVRIFTVQEELRFAGHPTLGTAAVIRRRIARGPQTGCIRLELNAGVVPVSFDPVTFENSDRTGGQPHPNPAATSAAIWGEMTQPEARLGAQHSREALAPVLGLASEDLSPDWPPQTASTGMPFCIVPLRSVEALGRLRVHPGLAEEYLRTSDAKFFYGIAREAAGEWRARMQFYNGEDPATGSAAGCATVYLVGNGIEPAGQPIHLRQGIEMQRPSDLYGRASLVEGKVAEVRVGGCTVLVAKGQLFLEQFT
jgi:trans-2,3-dihydro-3-hydroxyanthranilate isomerase